MTTEARGVPMVSQWETEGQTISERFLRSAGAYLRSAVAQCDHLLQQSNPSYYDMLVVDFLAEHAIELFFKGPIHQSTGKSDKTHSLETLHRQYHKLYPSQEFRFQGDIENFVARHPGRPNGQYPRYPVDTRGEPWNVSEFFNITVWHSKLSVFLNDFERLIPLISETHASV